MYNNQPPNYEDYNNRNQLNNLNNGVALPASNTVNNGMMTPINAFNTNNAMSVINMNGTNSALAYGQIMAQTQQQNQNEYKDILLNQQYPVKFVVVHAIITGAISAAMIGLQIFMIINKLRDNYYTGIWVGAYFLIPISLELLIIKKRSYCLFMIPYLMNFIGIVVTIIGVMINIKPLSSNCSKIFSINLNSTCDFTYNFVIIGLAAALFISCLVFVTAIRCLMPGLNAGVSVGGNRNRFRFRGRRFR